MMTKVKIEPLERAGHLSLKLLRAEIEGGQDVAQFAKYKQILSVINAHQSLELRPSMGINA